MHYIIGDIHGCLDKLYDLYERHLKRRLTKEDTLVFIGDYIDRGRQSMEVVDFLLALSRIHNAVFLRGNHESMFLRYLEAGDNRDMYFYNGGDRTVQSYSRETGRLEVPPSHLGFFRSLLPYYEGGNFIAVHAGLNPRINGMERQSEEDMTWIREQFFLSGKRWEKTVIFGHTPTVTITHGAHEVYFDEIQNIIGIDTGAVYGGRLSCVRMPGREVFQS